MHVTRSGAVEGAPRRVDNILVIQLRGATTAESALLDIRYSSCFWSTCLTDQTLILESAYQCKVSAEPPLTRNRYQLVFALPSRPSRTG